MKLNLYRMNGFTPTLVLIQRQKPTQKWSVLIPKLTLVAETIATNYAETKPVTRLGSRQVRCRSGLGCSKAG